MQKITDFHSHILPGIDDGSDSIAASLVLLEMSAAQGIGHMVATPHFYAHREPLEDFLDRRSRAEQLLRLAVREREDLPDFSVGAEVFFFRGMSETDMLHRLTLGNSPYILVEMPFTRWTEAHYRELENIWTRQGITPVVAHVERYFGRFSDRGIPRALADLPVLVQSNASFFLKRGSAMKLLKEGKVHLLGSDCHDPDRRPPKLGDAVSRIRDILGESALARLQQNGQEILSQL